MSASKEIKRLYHEHCKGKTELTSLKNFVKTLKGEKAKVVADWVANKAGELERVAKETRQNNKGKMLSEMRMATKSAKRKSKSGNSASK